MTTNARARKPRQLHIIDDTSLARDEKKRAPYLMPGPLLKNRGDLSTATPPRNRGDLSTATPPQNRGDLSTASRTAVKAAIASGEIRRLDAKRKALGVSVAKLCAAAGIYPLTYTLAVRGKVATRVVTVRKIAEALRRFQKGETPSAPRSMLEQLLRLMIVQISEELQVDPQTVFDTDFSSENTNDPKWLQASRIRGAAIYVIVEGAGISKAAAAHAAGVSRQAAFKAVAVAELQRDRDQNFDRIMRNLIVTVGKR